MAGTSEDTSLEEAQKEIHRGLLRQEKLKRIEEEEMRRLAAMGWQPPRGGPAAHRGPSVHDAADAIEVTEQKRRAFAQEAQRRAEARQNDPIAMRSEFEVRRRGEDRKATEQSLNATEELLNQVAQNYGWSALLGSNQTASALRRYLDKTGGTIQFSPEYLRQFDAVKNPEARIQQHFVDWIANPKVRRETVYVDDLPRTLTVTSRWQRLGEELSALKDGETIERNSYWTAPFDWSTLSDIDPSIAELDLWGVAGKAQLRGDGDFKFTRQGDQIKFRGFVNHSYRDRYDFESGTEFPTLQMDPLTFQGEDARQLALHGRAKEFGIRSGWSQRVTGTLQVTPEGEIELVGDPKWADIDPYDKWNP